MTAVQLRTSDAVADFVRRFALPGPLAGHVAAVLRAMPAAAREDLVGDAGFRIVVYEPNEAGAVPVGLPGRLGRPGRGGPARAVALRRSLADRPAAFVRWLVAHELAHAHLRNGGRTPGEDPEAAADALAAEWGFARPATR